MSGDPETNYEEKRRHKRLRASFIVTYRLPAPIRVQLKTADHDFTAVGLDISAGGLGVVVNEPVPVAVRLRLSFTLVNPHPGPDREMRRWFELDGKALYCAPVPKSGYRAGIQFENVPREDADFI